MKRHENVGQPATTHIPALHGYTPVSEPKPSSAAHHHRKSAARSVATVVITVSDTRTFETDAGAGGGGHVYN